ncbi:MAG: hypothetical protein IJU76_14910 [Desulfovibrionaceae bacterium]|nr:hypothetical protein [Desulfovibrionaceae bacterium]
MGYSIEDIRKSQAIFYYLLEHHHLDTRGNKELYTAFIESDDIQLLVKTQGEVSDCEITRYENVIYLIPNEDNCVLGYSKAELRGIFCKSDSDEYDYYLSLFAILVLMLSFYDGYGLNCKIRDYLKFSDFQNSIGEYLKKGVNRHKSEDEQNAIGLMFTSMSQRYESLRSEDKITKKKTTKEGFLYSILKFLENQGLIDYIPTDEMIKTKPKFDHFMNWNLLDKNNYDRIFNVLKEISEDSK